MKVEESGANKNNKWQRFISILIIIVLVAGFIFQIMTTPFLSEAQKYFVITLLLYLFILAYIKFIVEKGRE